MKHFMKIAAVLCLISMNKSFAMDEKAAHEVWKNVLEPAYRASWNQLNSLLHDYNQYGLTAKEGTKSDSDLKKMYSQFLNDWGSKGWGESKLVTINKNHTVEIFSNGLHKHFLTLPGFTEGTHRMLEILQYENHIPYALQQHSIIDEEKSATFASSSLSSSNSVSATTTTPASSSSVSKKTASEAQKPAIRIEADSIGEALGILIDFFRPIGQTSTKKSNSASSSASTNSVTVTTAKSITSQPTESISVSSSVSSSITPTLTKEAQALFSSTVPAVAALAMTAMAMQTKSARN